MDKIVRIGDSNYAFKYTEIRYRTMTNEERYEGNIRADFSAKCIEYKEVKIVRLYEPEIKGD
jgi:hypothetical protein